MNENESNSMFVAINSLVLHLVGSLDVLYFITIRLYNFRNSFTQPIAINKLLFIIVIFMSDCS